MKACRHRQIGAGGEGALPHGEGLRTLAQSRNQLVLGTISWGGSVQLMQQFVAQLLSNSVFDGRNVDVGKFVDGWAVLVGPQKGLESATCRDPAGQDDGRKIM